MQQQERMDFPFLPDMTFLGSLVPNTRVNFILSQCTVRYHDVSVLLSFANDVMEVDNHWR